MVSGGSCFLITRITISLKISKISVVRSFITHLIEHTLFGRQVLITYNTVGELQDTIEREGYIPNGESKERVAA
jgi:hypothetical protein